MNIAVVGIGYVGLSLAVLLSQNNKVTALDILSEKVDMLNRHISPISDKDIERYLLSDKLSLKATVDDETAYKNADFVIIATPTNYDVENNYFDTSSVEAVIKKVYSVNKNAVIVIKSTLPVGFTERVIKNNKELKLLFSPEFLREGKALYDNLHPSRIIVGVPKGNDNLRLDAEKFADMLKEAALEEDVPILFTSPTEAEAIKLFANTYLATRVAFFNELDTYCEINGLDTKNIIEGVCLDRRIGNHYNNPSFGYGGYCFPKDTKQLRANFNNVPNKIISAVVDSNVIRKQFIVDRIMSKKPKIVGIYRLIMKSGSDNFRESAIQDIMYCLKEKGVDIIVYEPSVVESTFSGFEVMNDLDKFKKTTDIILANRFSEDIRDVEHKLYTRDIFFRD